MQSVQEYSLEERHIINVNVEPISSIVICSCLISKWWSQHMFAIRSFVFERESLFVFFYFRGKYLYVYSICVCISLAISAWWRAQRLCTKWLTVALAAGLDPPWGENILALHKFLTRFQIAVVSILFSAPAALNQQWDSPMTCSCSLHSCITSTQSLICSYKLEILIQNY